MDSDTFRNDTLGTRDVDLNLQVLLLDRRGRLGRASKRASERDNEKRRKGDD